MDAGALAEAEMMPHRSTMDELSQTTLAAGKVLVF